MTTIVWDQVGSRFFESGLDRGVLYTQDREGVPWNGLISVDETTAASASPIFWDGQKYGDIVEFGEFEYALRAYTYPDEFLEYEGLVQDQTGIFLTNQDPLRFHLAYRTRVGSDTNNEVGYKLHILYNCIAIPADRTRETLTIDPEPQEFEWSLRALPEELPGFRATPHVIIDSRKIDNLLLKDIEDILYGTEEAGPRLPTLKALTAFIRKWDRLIITDNGDGTWTAEASVEGYIEMLDSTTFQITSDTAVLLDPDTYEISSTDKNEEDIWLL